jgi:DNA-binding transcriptional regulator YiaG
MPPIDLNKTSLSLPNNTPSVVAIADRCNEEEINSKRKRSKKRSEHLHIETIRKMVWRILTGRHLTEEKLAHALGVTVKSLKQLYSENPPLTLASKINLPLIKLYCSIKFYN